MNNYTTYLTILNSTLILILLAGYISMRSTLVHIGDVLRSSSKLLEAQMKWIKNLK